MAWTYAPDFATARDRARLVLGDTDPDDPLLQDEEIAAYLPGGQLGAATESSAWVECCRAILAKLSRRVDITAGGTSVRLGQQVAAYKDRLDVLIRKSAEGAVPYVGGISASDVRAREADADRVPPFFTRTTGDPPASSRPNSWDGWR